MEYQSRSGISDDFIRAGRISMYFSTKRQSLCACSAYSCVCMERMGCAKNINFIYSLHLHCQYTTHGLSGDVCKKMEP